MNKPIHEMTDYGLLVVDRIEAMVAYWDEDLVCRFANHAYVDWFGKTREEMVDKMTLKELLGPIYEKNLPYITEALKGNAQQFEREIRTPQGEMRHSLANYYPDFYNGKVRGFSVHVTDITGQKKLQNELRKSNELLYSLFNNTPAGIAIRSLHDEKWKDVNNKFLELFGFNSKDEVIGKTVLESNVLYHPEQRTEIARLLSENKIVKDYEIEIKSKKGEDKWLSTSELLIDIDKTPCVLAVSVDITERKKSEELLKASEDKFRCLFNFSPLGLILTSAEGKLIEANSAVLDMMGMKSMEELISTPAQDYYVNPDDRIRMFNLLQKDGFVKGFEFEVKKKNGERVWISNNMAPFSYGDKNTQMISAAVDITARKKIEKELLESKEKFRKIFQSSPVGIVINKLSDSRYVEVNEAFCKITGYSEEEVIGRTSIEFGLILDVDERKRIIERVKKNGFENEFELSIRHKSGKILNILTLIETIMVSGELYAINIIYDITQRKLAEQQLKEANHELEAFSYSVAHDLRAPLRSVHGYAEILNQDYERLIDAEGKRIIGNIKYYASKMGRLIDDLLLFSRLGRKEIRFSKVSMNQLTNAVIAEINSSSSHNIEILVNELPDVSGDYNLLGQVMVNLISNAIKYSSKEEKPIVQISAETKNGEIVFSIKDNGVGFDMRYYDKLFGVFQRLHSEKEFGGTGIGLAFVQRVIKKHGGRIWAEGKVNGGATFYFVLNKIGNDD